MSDKPFQSVVPMVYALMLNDAREIARAHGYALAVHGSLMNDLDVVAIPWAEQVSEPEQLIASLAKATHHLLAGKPVGPEQKPHGRQAWAICMGHGLVMDISIMPTRNTI